MRQGIKLSEDGMNMKAADLEDEKGALFVADLHEGERRRWGFSVRWKKMEKKKEGAIIIPKESFLHSLTPMELRLWPEHFCRQVMFLSVGWSFVDFVTFSFPPLSYNLFFSLSLSFPSVLSLTLQWKQHRTTALPSYTSQYYIPTKHSILSLLSTSFLHLFIFP